MTFDDAMSDPLTRMGLSQVKKILDMDPRRASSGSLITATATIPSMAGAINQMRVLRAAQRPEDIVALNDILKREMEADSLDELLMMLMAKQVEFSEELSRRIDGESDDGDDEVEPQRLDG